MPELPEVETVRRGLEQKLKSFIIKKVEICRESTVAYPIDKKDLIEGLNNSHICKWNRRGKYLIAELNKTDSNNILANEMKMICDELKIDYDKVVEYSTYDERLGKSHWAVPGPDGKLGFGGSCFPKDLNALIKTAEKLNIFTNVLNSVWDTNLDVRPEEDWKELKGRAVVE